MSKMLKFAAFQHVTVSHVSHLLHGLLSNNATGIDKISCKIIKLAAPVISDSLTLIFNRAIALSAFPHEWKVARVIPLYKIGQRNIPGNYRPISVLPAISKIMEQILYDQLYSYRNQKCQIKNSFSSECLIKCGVPQGSILGPLFFLLYTKDLFASLSKQNKATDVC